MLHTYTHAYTYAYKYPYMPTHTYVNTCIHTHVRTDTHTHIYIYTYIYIHACMRTSVHTCKSYVWLPKLSKFIFIQIVLCLLSLIGWDLMYGNKEIRVRGVAAGWGTALQAGRSRVRFPLQSLEFVIDLILPDTLLPWGLLSFWRKWVKAAGA